MIDKIIEIIKSALKDSTALAFLIFSSIFVIFSIKYGVEKYILIAFFTFFYAFIVYRIRVISKKEVWGDYAVGDNWGAGLYFLIDWLLFIGWIAGLLFLLADFVPIFSRLADYSSIFLWIMAIFIGLALAIFIVWIIKMFCTKCKIENINCEKPNETKCYEVESCCKNCDLERKVKIPKRIRVTDFPCPECKVGGVLRKKGACEK